MPIDVSLVVDYHYREAARHTAWADAAGEDGNLSEANYHRAQAQRYLDAAEEQKRDMLLLPGQQRPSQPGRHWPMIQPPRPFLAVCVTGIMRGAGQVAGAIQQAIPKRSQPSGALSIR